MEKKRKKKKYKKKKVSPHTQFSLFIIVMIRHLFSFRSRSWTFLWTYITNTSRIKIDYWQLVILHVFGVKGNETYAMWALPASTVSLTLCICFISPGTRYIHIYIYNFYLQAVDVIHVPYFSNYSQCSINY